MTPLHLLIAKEVVVEKNLFGKYILVLMCKKGVNVNKYYFDKMPNSLYSIKISMSKFFIINIIKTIFISIKIRRYASIDINVTTGNWKIFYPRLLARLLGVKFFSVMDDGAGSLIKSPYFSKFSERKISKIIFYIIGKNYLYSNIMSNIVNYYTIFEQVNPAFGGHKIRLKLFKSQEFADKINLPNDKKNISILLLPSYSDDTNSISFKEEKKITKNIINKFQIDYAIPHPVNNVKRYKNIGCELIVNNKIAEEVLISLLGRFNITLVGFRSTVLLNMKNISLSSGVGEIRLVNVDIWKNRPKHLYFEDKYDIFTNSEFNTVYYDY